MTKKAKIIVVAGGAAVALVMAVVTTFLIFAHLFSRRYGAELEDSRQRGMEFGTTADNRDCQAESVRQIERPPPPPSSAGMDGVKEQYFFSGCLETSRPDPDFCAGVPTGQEDILAGERWKDARCQEFGWQEMNPNCRAVMRARLEFCEKR